MTLEDFFNFFQPVTDQVQRIPNSELVLQCAAGILIALLLLIRLSRRENERREEELSDPIKKDATPQDEKRATKPLSREVTTFDGPSVKDTQTVSPLKDTSVVESPTEDTLHEEQVVKDNFEQEPEDLKEPEQSSDDLTPEESLEVRLKKSRTGFFSKIKALFSAGTALDQDTVEELHSILLTSDIGVATTQNLVEQVKEQISSSEGVTKDQVLNIIKTDLKARLLDRDVETLDGQLPHYDDKPAVVMIVGVNGVGKTTTIAKLAYRWKNSGKKVMMAAGDTFRAAAVEQLSHWGKELDVAVVTGAENAKPSAVVFEALDKAINDSADVLLIDTAGRLHNKSNLMQELSGVRNVLQKKMPAAPHETWLVLDGSTGQNALQQAQEFHKAVPLTGVIVTKLDGTAKGGIVAAIKEELGIPVRFIGVGESRANLRVFNSNDFVEALFDEGGLDLSEEESAVEPRRRRRRRTA